MPGLRRHCTAATSKLLLAACAALPSGNVKLAAGGVGRGVQTAQQIGLVVHGGAVNRRDAHDPHAHALLRGRAVGAIALRQQSAVACRES